MTLSDTLSSVLSSAARALWRNPRIALAIWVVFSLGIGSISAVFSVVEKVLLEPLPFPAPDRLVQLATTSFHVGDEGLASIPKYLIWHENSGPFESLAANDVDAPDMNLVQPGERKALKASRVSAEYFHLFGAEFAVGRPFLGLEDNPSGPNVVILGNGAWRRYFHSASSLTGRTIVLDDIAYKVVGVLSPTTHLDPVADLWLPLRADPRSTDPIGRVRVVARVREGISIAQAQRDLIEAINNNPSPSLRAHYGEIFATGDSKLVPLRDAIVGDVRPSLYTLLGAASFGLAICCLNTAMLFLARASYKKRDVAIRMAMGASRVRIVAELLTESILLSLSGGFIGLLLGFGGVRAVLAVSPTELPRLGANGSSITLNETVFFTTLSISLFLGALCALAPALHSSRQDFGVLLKQGVSESGMALRRGQWRSILIAVEISFSLVLLVGAGLLIRTFVAKRAISRGFDDENVITVRVSLRNPRFDATAELAQMVRYAERRIQVISGVKAVATTSALPLAASLPMPFKVFEYNTSAGLYDGVATWRSVSPNYFRVFGIGLLRGRLFTDGDDEHAPAVVLINRAMAKRYWTDINANPVGDYLSIGHVVEQGPADPPRQIVGVVADIHDAGLDREPAMYVPAAQVSDWMNARNNRLAPMIWAIRVDEGQSRMAPRLLQELSSVLGGQPIGPPTTMREAVAASSARIRFYIILLSLFSGLALVLTGMGTYSLLSYSVDQRRKELAIRSALGAAPIQVQAIVVTQALRLTAAGASIGIPLALILARITISLVYDVRSWDPAVLVLVGLLLCVVSLFAAYLPAIRASKCDPAAALRTDT